MAKPRIFIPKLSGAIEWESLAQLRTLSILKVGYFGAITTPVVSHAITTFNSFAEPTSIKLALPSSIFVTFIGSVILSVGHFLNEAICPKLIKTHGTLRGFQKYIGEVISDDQKIMSSAESIERLIALYKAKSTLPKDYPQELIERAVDALVKRITESWNQLDADAPLVHEYEENWRATNKSLAPVRYTIALCYAASAAVATYLAVSQLHSVFVAAFWNI